MSNSIAASRFGHKYQSIRHLPKTGSKNIVADSVLELKFG